MPAPRYFSEHQENAVWISMATLWAIGACGAWISAVLAPWHSEISGSLLTILAMLTACASLALRLPILSSPPETSQFCDHLIWLLTGCATANWLGFFVVQSPALVDAFPAIAALAFGEVWFHTIAFRKGLLPWLSDGFARLIEQLSSLGSDTCEPADGLKQENLHLEIQQLGFDGSENITRHEICGIDENGGRYMSGTIRVSLADGQKHETIVVGFCPAFVGQPNVDFECNAEDISWELINCSPAGMRIGVRRSQAETSTDFELQWYAAQAEMTETSIPMATTQVLP